MQVIGAGYGRTGTSSLQKALAELLGGKCYHMKDIMTNPVQLEAWHDFAVGKTLSLDWKSLFEGYAAAVDCPVCLYYRELMNVFPEAKVILTVRDADSWWRSFNRLMSLVEKTRMLCFASHRLRKIACFTDTIIIEKAFNGRLEKEQCIRAFENHNAAVRNTVPQERLLEYDVQQGWQPLCDFLDLAAPDKPFPHLNAGRWSLYKLFGKGLLQGM
jgi:hypothetical protein